MLLALSPSVPLVETETRVVVPASMSRTNTSMRSLVSPGTRFVALDSKVTRDAVWRERGVDAVAVALAAAVGHGRTLHPTGREFKAEYVVLSIAVFLDEVGRGEL